jgi:hypothetical protein
VGIIVFHASPLHCSGVQFVLRVRAKINSQILSVEAPAGQGVKVQEYKHIPSFRNTAGQDASAHKM